MVTEVVEIFLLGVVCAYCCGVLAKICLWLGQKIAPADEEKTQKEEGR